MKRLDLHQRAALLNLLIDERDRIERHLVEHHLTMALSNLRALKSKHAGTVRRIARLEAKLK